MNSTLIVAQCVVVIRTVRTDRHLAFMPHPIHRGWSNPALLIGGGVNMCPATHISLEVALSNRLLNTF